MALFTDLPNFRTTLPSDLPRHSATAHCRSELQRQSLFDQRLSWRQAGFGGNALRGLCQFSITQRSQQVAGEDVALLTALRQYQFFEEVGTLPRGLPGVAARAQVAQPATAANQLLIKPSGTDCAGLPHNLQIRLQFNGHSAQPLRVVLAARTADTFPAPSVTRFAMPTGAGLRIGGHGS